MEIIPAIDLKGGKCVRLRQGLADKVTVYSGDPVFMARHWVRQGGRFLHVVDLDGAFSGKPVHTDVIAEIAREAGVPVEVGGGLRTPGDISMLLDCGVKRVVVGTRACEDPAALVDLVAQFGDRLAVGIDVRDGLVRVEGWARASAVRGEDLAARADQAGVKTIIFTETAADGMMTGVPIDSLDRICAAVSCSVIASGGVASADDVRALCSLERPNLTGVIVGRALYEGKVSMAGLLSAAALTPGEG